MGDCGDHAHAGGVPDREEVRGDDVEYKGAFGEGLTGPWKVRSVDVGEIGNPKGVHHRSRDFWPRRAGNDMSEAFAWCATV